MCYAVLAPVSRCYSTVQGRLLTRYSPVRHCPLRASSEILVRLECVRHAASVHPEPGSNSLKMVYILPALQQAWNINFAEFYLSLITCFWFVFFQRIDKGSSTLYTRGHIFELSFVHVSSRSNFHLIGSLPFSLFNFQGPLFTALLRRLDYYITLFFVCQEVF